MVGKWQDLRSLELRALTVQGTQTRPPPPDNPNDVGGGSLRQSRHKTTLNASPIPVSPRVSMLCILVTKSDSSFLRRKTEKHMTLVSCVGGTEALGYNHLQM